MKYHPLFKEVQIEQEFKDDAPWCDGFFFGVCITCVLWIAGILIFAYWGIR